MKTQEKVLLNVDYTDDTGKFWQESHIKNKIFILKGDIHKTIAKAVEDVDGITLLYKGKPRANVYHDDKDGNTVPVGYMYRGRTEIQNDNTGKWQKVTFDVWVTIHKVELYDIKEIN